MSEEKKYFWLKLPKTFFADVRIKKIRKLAGGDTYTIIYQRLLLECINNNGVLKIEDIGEDPIEYLALLIDEDIDNVKVCIELLLKLNLCEIVNDEIFFLQALSLVGNKTDNAVRQERFRNKKQEALYCNTEVTSSNEESNITIYKELELEKESELNIELEKEHGIISTSKEITDTAELEKFHTELIKAHEDLTARTVSDYDTLFKYTCLAGTDPEKELLKKDVEDRFNNRHYDFTECIKAAIKLKDPKQTNSNYLWQKYLVDLVRLLKNGNNQISKYVSPPEKEKIKERLRQEREEQEQKKIESDLVKQKYKDIAKKLGITLYDLYSYETAITKLNLTSQLGFTLEQDTEKDVRNYMKKHIEVHHDNKCSGP